VGAGHRQRDGVPGREGLCLREERRPLVLVGRPLRLAQQLGQPGALRAPRASPQLVIDVRLSGAVGDGKNDDTNAIQIAINAALAGSTPVVHLPAGAYRITRPLLILPPPNRPFASVTITGDGAAANADRTGGTYIIAEGDAGIVIQSARGVRIKDLCVFGPYAPRLSKRHDTIFEYLDERTWQSPFRDSRYSPHAGLVIDFTSGQLPPDGGYPQLQALYQKHSSHSADIQIDNVSIHGFVVGAVLDPSGGDQLTSEILFRRAGFSNCKVAVASCHTQSFNLRMDDTQINFVRTAVSTFEYGLQKAPPPIVFGGNWSNCREWFAVQGGSGNLYVNGLYGEAVVSLGHFGPTFSPANGAALFSGCNITFAASTTRQADAHLYSHMDMRFDGCSFSTTIPLRIANQALLSFETCRFSYDTDRGIDFIALNAAYEKLASFSRCRLSTSTGLQWITRSGAFRETVLAAEADVQFNDGHTATIDLPDARTLKVGQLLHCATQLPIADSRDSTKALSSHNLTLLGRVAAIEGNRITLDSLPRSLTPGKVSHLSVRKTVE
jgi:hypothetical protein